MTLRTILFGCLVPMAALAQAALNIAPIPDDPLELAATGVMNTDSPVSRDAALALLARARANFGLTNSDQAYRLRVKFEVNSGGETAFDGAWDMEDIFVPRRGLQWTAKASAGYSISHIAANGRAYSESALEYVPLRLQEARTALFDPMPTVDNLKRAVIRTAPASFNGRAVTCILSGSPINGANPLGRRWDETEECIDPQSGLLQTHSQVAGRYLVYEYSSDLQIAGHMIPKTITVTEAGRIVSKINVESLAPLQAFDTARFVPTPEMKEKGRAIGTAGALKVSHVVANGSVAPGATAHPVIIFGVITPAGDLVEAHSLQPADPNSQAALDATKQMAFSPMPNPPQQRFVFIIEQFVSGN